MTEAMPREAVTIRDVVYPGRGLASLSDGRIVFIPEALAGERVEIAIVKQHKQYAVGRVVEILTPSPHRIATACGDGSRAACPGCVYQHIAYPFEVDIKHRQLDEILRRLGRLDTDIRLPATASPVDMHYRNKIVLHAAPGGDGVKLGYIRDDNTTVHDVESCLLAMEPINVALSGIRSDTAFMSSLKPGMSVTLRHTREDGTVFWRANETVEPSRLTEDTPFGPVVVPRRSFYQVNPAAANLLFAAVGEAVTRLAPEFVIDLYCGCGVFSLAALHAGTRAVYGIDSDSRAIRAARHNVMDHRFHSQAFFTAQSAYEGLHGIPARVTPESTLVMVDPPRGGLDRDLVQLLCTVKPGHILYISCAPDTLARDMARFRESGYAPRSARLFDLFPRTPHFETLMHLEYGR